MLIHLNPANAEVHLIRSSFKSLCFTETSRVQPELQVSWLLHRQKISLDVAAKCKGPDDQSALRVSLFWGQAYWEGAREEVCTRRCVLCLVASVSDSLRPVYCGLPGSSVHWDFPGKNTGVDFHALLQSIFLTQRLNSGLLHAGRVFTIWASREAREYWNRQPTPSPGDLSYRGIELGSPRLQVASLAVELPGKPVQEDNCS